MDEETRTTDRSYHGIGFKGLSEYAFRVIEGRTEVNGQVVAEPDPLVAELAKIVSELANECERQRERSDEMARIINGLARVLDPNCRLKF